MLYLKISDQWIHFYDEKANCDVLVSTSREARVVLSGEAGFVFRYLSGKWVGDPPVPVYHECPPAEAETFLEYLPREGGLSPSLWVESVSGAEKARRNADTSHCGQRFFNGWPSGPKRKRLEAWNKAQRQERRHLGDCPKPT